MFLALPAAAQSSCSAVNQPTLNSCRSSRYVGDETRFYSAKDSGHDTRGGYEDSINVSDGQTILVRVTVHNNAKSRAAKDVRTKITLPEGQVSSYTSTATISSANASSVSDTARFTNERPFKIRYVEDSVRYYGVNQTMKKPNGNIQGSGVLIGNVPAGESSVGYLTFRVKITEVSTEKAAPVKKPTQKTVVRETTVSTPKKEVDTVKTVTVEPEVPVKTVTATPSPPVKTVSQPAPTQYKTVGPPPDPAPMKTLPEDATSQSQAQSQSQSQTAPSSSSSSALPQTGMAESGAAGMAAIGIGSLLYARSRRRLNQSAAANQPIRKP